MEIKIKFIWAKKSEYNIWIYVSRIVCNGEHPLKSNMQPIQPIAQLQPFANLNISFAYRILVPGDLFQLPEPKTSKKYNKM